MFKFLKKSKNQEVSEQTDANSNALRLLIHLSLVDGNIDNSDIEELKKFIKDKSLGQDLSAFLEKEIDAVKLSSSFYDEIYRINNEFSDNEKLELIELIWSLIIADDVIDPYEENLFYRIGELIKVKRTLLNKIKSRAS